MLSGQALFTGETVSHVLGAVLQVEPQWDALPTATPHGLKKLIRRCLEKERKRRLRDIRDTLAELDEAFTAERSEQTSVPHPAAQRRSLRGVASIVLGGIVIGTTVWALTRAAPATQPVRSSSPLPAWPVTGRYPCARTRSSISSAQHRPDHHGKPGQHDRQDDRFLKWFADVGRSSRPHALPLFVCHVVFAPLKTHLRRRDRCK